MHCVSQKISQDFKELTPDARQTYEATSAKLKAEGATKRAAIAAARVPGPVTAYLLFYKTKYQENKAAHPDKTVIELAKLVGKQWLELSVSEKQLYKAEADMLRDSRLAQKRMTVDLN